MCVDDVCMWMMWCVWMMCVCVVYVAVFYFTNGSLIIELVSILYCIIRKHDAELCACNSSS